MRVRGCPKTMPCPETIGGRCQEGDLRGTQGRAQRGGSSTGPLLCPVAAMGTPVPLRDACSTLYSPSPSSLKTGKAETIVGRRKSRKVGEKMRDPLPLFFSYFWFPT